MATKKPVSTKDRQPKTLILGIYAYGNPIKSQEHYFEEFKSLVKTAGIEYDEEMFIKLRSIDKSMFLTKGKLQEVEKLCKEKDIKQIACSEPLSPLQERNLEDFLDCPVSDREHIILEIFRDSAHSAEGKIQVEMAELEYYKTRLAGKGAELAQQAGHIGTRGPGETEKELIKRHLTEKFRQAHKKIERLKKSREVQRKKRLLSGVPLICLVGYTNAGKSSILNRLTKSEILEEDKLFATLDTTTRELFIDHKKIGLLLDTVGFISQLPHHLITAFKSTLDELKYASLLLHVIDLSNPSWRDQVEIVLDTLEEIDIKRKNMLFVFNKIDQIPSEKLDELKEELEEYQPYVLASALSRDGLKNLISYLQKHKFKN